METVLCGVLGGWEHIPDESTRMGMCPLLDPCRMRMCPLVGPGRVRTFPVVGHTGMGMYPGQVHSS